MQSLHGDFSDFTILLQISALQAFTLKLSGGRGWGGESGLKYVFFIQQKHTKEENRGNLCQDTGSS